MRQERAAPLSERELSHVSVIRLAASQRGHVTREQLVGAGFDDAWIRRERRRGWLHRRHTGVYRVGPGVDPLADEAAALLACGSLAVLSHRSAAAIWGLVERDERVVDVTVPTRRRSREGIRVHEAAVDAWTREGLRVTSVIRTIADLAATAPPKFVEQAVGEALFRRVVTEEQLRAVPRVRAMLDRGRGGSRHEAERLLNELIVGAGLPRPRRNVRMHGHELDFFWPAHRLNLELDGFQGHGHRLAFERDRRRDLHLKRHGVDTLRTTWRQLTAERDALLVTLVRAIG